MKRRKTVADSRIGIKIADGSFYPIMEEGKRAKKRLVLTTVNDRQTNVQIDLYRGREEIESASYIGSLLIENIPAAAKGSPEIELVVGIDDDGNLTAEASEGQSGEKRTLSVRIDDNGTPSAYDIPDFDLSQEPSEGFEPDFPFDELDGDSDKDVPPSEDFFSETSDDYPLEEEVPRRSRIRPLLITLLVILSLAFIGLLIYCLMNYLPGEKALPLRASGNEVEQTAPVAESPPVPVPVPQATVEQAPVPERETVRVEVEGVWYRIRWGDTLWDISSSFYSTPWLYGQIAEENNIKNPDIIFAEQKIFIPTK
jgi:hypothetical protein